MDPKLLILIGVAVAIVAIVALIAVARHRALPPAVPSGDAQIAIEPGVVTAAPPIALDLPPEPVTFAPLPEPSGPPDDLTMLKGLGPKAATRLAELGVTRFDQIAAWDESQAARVDGEMGPFRGRMARDRWIEQARLLAAGDRTAFEAAFGKLG